MSGGPTTENVEAVARDLDRLPQLGTRYDAATITDVARLLRSLATERDELLAKVAAVEEWALAMLDALNTAGEAVARANSAFAAKKAAFERGADEP